MCRLALLSLGCSLPLRCFLPATAFRAYERHAPETVWWKTSVRTERVPPEIVEAVLCEVRDKGPIKATELTDQGSVKPLDWSGWKSTSKASSMALDILWTQCKVRCRIGDESDRSPV